MTSAGGWVPDEDWEVSRWTEGRRCRFPRCTRPAVAALFRKVGAKTRRTRWAYCEHHVSRMGCKIENGVLLRWKGLLANNGEEGTARGTMGTKARIPLELSPVTLDWRLPCGCAFHYWDGPHREWLYLGEVHRIGSVDPHMHPCSRHKATWEANDGGAGPPSVP